MSHALHPDLPITPLGIIGRFGETTLVCLNCGRPVRYDLPSGLWRHSKRPWRPRRSHE